MKLLAFVIRDRAANVFDRPFFAIARGAAIRSFSDAVNGGDPNFSKHPGDFDLFELGTYDDNTGLFETGVPHQIAVGKDLVVRDVG